MKSEIKRVRYLVALTVCSMLFVPVVQAAVFITVDGVSVPGGEVTIEVGQAAKIGIKTDMPTPTDAFLTFCADPYYAYSLCCPTCPYFDPYVGPCPSVNEFIQDSPVCPRHTYSVSPPLFPPPGSYPSGLFFEVELTGEEPGDVTVQLFDPVFSMVDSVIVHIVEPPAYNEVTMTVGQMVIVGIIENSATPSDFLLDICADSNDTYSLLWTPPSPGADPTITQYTQDPDCPMHNYSVVWSASPSYTPPVTVLEVQLTFEEPGDITIQKWNIAHTRLLETLIIHIVRGPIAFHVDGTSGSDSNDGLSAGAAFATIQAGIDAAVDGDTVLVWPCVYQEECDFLGKAITVTSAADAAVVYSPTDYAFRFHNAEGPDSRLENLVLAGGMYGVEVNVACSPTLKNLTVADNEFGIACYENGEPNIINCIFANNLFGDLLDCTAKYSSVASYGDDDPMFVDPNSGDYHLLSERGRYRATTNEWLLDDVTSPCVDGGDPMESGGDERTPNGGRVNMGAYGGTAYGSMSEWPLVGDNNRDGRVDIADFAAQAGEWLMALPWAQ